MMAYRYKTVKRGGKTKLLHRHLAEQKLGRPLSPDEHVHHGNEKPLDNRVDNLHVLSASDHRRLHADERLVYPRSKRCEICGVEFTPHPTKRRRQKTCSKPCADQLRSRTEKATKARALAASNYTELSAGRKAA
jgi:hypothetical protein